MRRERQRHVIPLLQHTKVNRRFFISTSFSSSLHRHDSAAVPPQLLWLGSDASINCTCSHQSPAAFSLHVMNYKF
ncbi:hypothetical protein O3P69_015310 [Scylla paramamosain]|uniref:Uncharacterized protein n=1 Tax=Scylla paramamosain TaxID=85552 RepID=A0AAW0T4G7_SCYPA